MTVAGDTAAVAEGSASPEPGADGSIRIAVLGNPNTGKTTLFNRLCGLRHKTSNFPGTTQEARVGRVRAHRVGEERGDVDIELIDLPGIYSLELEQTEAEICRRVLAGQLAPAGEAVTPPDAVLVVADASNLGRNLLLVGEALRRRLPTVLALNMIDLAKARGLSIDTAELSSRLGCPVVMCCARSGTGVADLSQAMTRAMVPHTTPGGTQEALESWADGVYGAVVKRDAEADRSGRAGSTLTDRLDRVFTHPVAGLAVFGAVMFGLFWTLFSFANYPMDWIEGFFGVVGGWVEAVLPPGDLRDFVAKGVVGGVGATVVFLPQICLLFFLIALLEDTGYLARGAFVMDRVLRPFGLSGHAFVPLLSSHACALPGIMACRAIPDRRERLASILVAPFMSCSARIPVYVLLAAILFPDSPLKQSAAFMGCYVLGIVAGLVSAVIVRRTLLTGASRPLAMELPTYKLPSLRTGLLTTYDRGMVFLKNAGTNILCIVIVLWWLSAYPRVDPPAEATAMREQAAAMIVTAGESQAAHEALLARADELESTNALAQSFAGRIGRAVQPVFAPLGFDWQLSIGVITSFAAREVFVSTMAVITTGHDEADEAVMEQIATARRDDGITPIFTRASSWALLVYYVLAMQCLPTLAVTAKEAGGAKWALLQLGWMLGLAYVFGLIVYQALRAAGVA